MTVCGVCGGSQHLTIETRDSVPIAQNLVFESRDEAVRCPAGSIEIIRCTNCGFVWNDKFDPGLLVYGTAYDNDQNFSARFRDHTAQIADLIVTAAAPGEPVRLVEVGCGQGAFLHVLARQFGSRLQSAIGFDPAWKGDAAILPAGADVRPEYFQAGSLDGAPAPNLVVSRHVIEHVPDTKAFLSAIRASVADGTLVVIETPDVDWILRNGVFFDFYYEHCSLFTPNSLSRALENAGFQVSEVRNVFDDQYMVAVARASSAVPTAATGHSFDDLGYREKRDRYLNALAELIDSKRERGAFALWGGASKGVTICLTLPEAAERIDCVVDINERKQGRFLPNSGMPVVGPAEAWERGVRSVLVVNPAYMTEIRTFCSQEGLAFDLVSIEEVEQLA
jgi:cyclopropane fatty-acyl-phospholipid synthase-like methyltransferase